MNSTNTENAPSYFRWNSPITILVVCSSPKKKDFPKQKDIVNKFFPDPINVIFLDGSKHNIFPNDLIVRNFSLDAIWFCGCNVLNHIFLDSWQQVLSDKLKSNGIVFFTESKKFVQRTCNKEGIFMDIKCYKNHPIKGITTGEKLDLFLNLFDENIDGEFIFYTKKNTPHNLESITNNHQWENNPEDYQNIPENVNPKKKKWWQFWKKGGRKSRKKKHHHKKRRKTRKKRGGLPEFPDEFDEDNTQWVPMDSEIWNHLKIQESLVGFGLKFRWWEPINKTYRDEWLHIGPGWVAEEIPTEGEIQIDEYGDEEEPEWRHYCPRCEIDLLEPGKIHPVTRGYYPPPYSCPRGCFAHDELEAHIAEEDENFAWGLGEKIILKWNKFGDDGAMKNLQILALKPKRTIKSATKGKKPSLNPKLPLGHAFLGGRRRKRKKTRKRRKKRKKKTRQRKRSGGMNSKKHNSSAPVQQIMKRGENKQNNNANSVIVHNNVEQTHPWNVTDAKRDLVKKIAERENDKGNENGEKSLKWAVDLN